MFIRLNLITEEVALERHKQIKKRAVVFYAIIWFFALFIIWLTYSDRRSLLKSGANEIQSMQIKIDEVAPGFFHSVKLLQKHKAYETKLAKVYNQSQETGFILEILENVAATLPSNFWVDELRFSSLDYKEFDDNIKGKNGEIKVLEIHGRLFFETGGENKQHVETFVEKIQKKRPFYCATSKVNLRDIKVGIEDKNYFHNFAVQFAWPEPYLF